MEEAVKTNGNGGRKKGALFIFAVVSAAAAVGLFFYMDYKKTHIATDDAFVEGSIHTVASKIPGTVKNVSVKSNQQVNKGDLLVELDPTDYSVRVNEAEASLNAEKARLAEIDARIAASKSQIEDAKAKADSIKAVNELQAVNLDQAEKDLTRAESLYKNNAISKEKYERASTAHKAAAAQVKAASEGLRSFMSTVEAQKAALKQAESARVTQAASIKQRESGLEAALLNAGYTKILAPSDGFVTKKSVEVGNQIQPGQPLMAVVRLNEISVAANFKETQVERIKPGQKVEIKVDAYPGKIFHGKVDSIMSGTGSSFSLFPPENATGNFVKVVQRIPVKIVFDNPAEAEKMLKVGMSVEPTVIVGK